MSRNNVGSMSIRTQLPCSEDPRSTSRNIYQECEPQQKRHMSRNTWECPGIRWLVRIEPKTSRTLTEHQTTRPSSPLSMKFGWIVTSLNQWKRLAPTLKMFPSHDRENHTTGPSSQLHRRNPRNFSNVWVAVGLFPWNLLPGCHRR